jgi:prevent-host-death family protein
MKTIAVYEAKNRLSEILAAVEQGEEYTITRRGAPIARLVAPLAGDRSMRDIDGLIAKIRAIRCTAPFSDAELLEAIEDGRD